LFAIGRTLFALPHLLHFKEVIKTQRKLSKNDRRRGYFEQIGTSFE